MSTVELEKRTPEETILFTLGHLMGEAWFLMLGLGVLHGHVKSVPAFGYGLCILLWFLLGRGASSYPAISTVTHKLRKS